MSILVGDNFSYSASKPLDGRLIYSTVASMKAVADSTMYDGCMAYCTATSKTYQWKSTNAVDETTGKWREFTSGSGDTIQVDTLPTAGADELGNVYQYIGSTTSTLTHGYFYECVSDGESTPTYSWSEVEVSKGGHDIKNDGVAVTSRDTMNFTDFDIADDSTNLETDIKAHRLTQAEMSEIMSTLPGTPTELPVMFDETGTERIVGWYKLANGTKKPVYARDYYLTGLGNIKSYSFNHGLSIDTVIKISCETKRINNSNFNFSSPLPYVYLTSENGSPYSNNSFGNCCINSTSIVIRRGTDIYEDDIVLVTVIYTKTTDTPV